MKDLRARLQADGFAILRDVVPHDAVIAARQALLDAYASEPWLDIYAPSDEGVSTEEMTARRFKRFREQFPQLNAAGQCRGL